MLLLQCEDISHPLWGEVIGFHAAAIKDCPFLVREIKQFGLADW